jgi:hypothetical protein
MRIFQSSLGEGGGILTLIVTSLHIRNFFWNTDCYGLQKQKHAL